MGVSLGETIPSSGKSQKSKQQVGNLLNPTSMYMIVLVQYLNSLSKLTQTVIFDFQDRFGFYYGELNITSPPGPICSWGH